MMKNIVLALVILSFFSGCKKDSIGIRFNMDYTTSFDIKSGNILSLPLDFFTPDITTNSETQFSENDTRKDKIQEIKLTSLSLDITNPDNATFDFLKHVYLYINADGLEEIRYAFKENIADGLLILNLDTEGVDLSEYIKKDKFSLRAECVQDKTLDKDLTVKADMVFAVKANPLK
ncbi:MAG: hypothetical protein KJP21_07890 [Bacteroidia bacterium]|nr:hypothetical protein [Bacteroidia bacterium]NNJ55144.1 hypothetical protein [Bacteroidia bacterium]